MQYTSDVTSVAKGALCWTDCSVLWRQSRSATFENTVRFSRPISKELGDINRFSTCFDFKFMFSPNVHPLPWNWEIFSSPRFQRRHFVSSNWFRSSCMSFLLYNTQLWVCSLKKHYHFKLCNECRLKVRNASTLVFIQLLFVTKTKS